MGIKGLDCKTEYHWFDEPDTVRVRLEKELWEIFINKAIAKAGSRTRLANATGLCKVTVFNYFHNISLTVGGVKKILNFLNIDYMSVEDKVREIAWTKNIKLPIKLNTPSMATILAAVIGDGTISEVHVEYKNKDSELLNKVEKEIKKTFGNVKIDHRISEKGIPYIVANKIVKRVLINVGVPVGKKLNKNSGVPKIIVNGSKRMQKAFIQQLFDDEGWVENTNYKIGLSQANECTNAINKKFFSGMKINKPYSINKIPEENRNNVLPPQLLTGIRKILHEKFLVESNLRLKRIIRRRKGYVTAFWELNVGKKESLLNFKNRIGFYCKRKRKDFDLMVGLRESMVPKDILSQIFYEGANLSKENGRFKVKEISKKVNLHPSRIRKRLQTLVKRGVFYKKNGDYGLNHSYLIKTFFNSTNRGLMQIGCVGKPSSGKSTFFSAATLTDVEIDMRPFTTIKANIGTGYITTKCVHGEFGKQCQPQNSKCVNGIRLIPIQLLDVAGLIEGSWQGKGLGNSFMSDLMQASALIHVLDVAGITDAQGNVCGSGTHDPAVDIKFLEREISYWIKSILTKNWAKISKQSGLNEKGPGVALAKQLSGLGISEDCVNDVLKEGNFSDKPYSWNEEEILRFSGLVRDKSKPLLIAANKIDLAGAREKYEKIKKEFPNYKIFPTSGAAELALRKAERNGIIKYVPGEDKFEIVKGDIDEKQRKGLDFIQKNILDKYGSTGIQNVLNKTAFELLDLIVVYPVEDQNKWTSGQGNILPDAYLLKRGSTPKDLSGKIHSDFIDKYIGSINCKTGQKISENYKLQNNDVIKIMLSH
ncbi:MAG: YchF-related putative GTPase [Candidatus Diapherotrites archaeon]